MPAARPSRPSMKLIALIVITTSKMVRGRLRPGSSETTPPLGVGSQGSDWPLQTRMPAAATCPASLLIALSPHRSSMNPTTTTNAPASSSPIAVFDPAARNGSCREVSRLATISPATSPPYMASPPSSGGGSGWVSRDPGRVTRAAPTPPPPHQRDEHVGHRGGDEEDEEVLAHAASVSPRMGDR